MVIRVRDKSRPGDDSRDIPCGPAVGRKHPYDLERRTIDDLPRHDGRKPLDFKR